ncbi:hypothetical protein BC830DRAFT_612259 [Chytriomyces sp. MP71]|nr:hypothetical protein BC830DRAFT_612259 [Chytriomyces sp. MP71]
MPYLEIFIDRGPLILQELCRRVDVKYFPANCHLFSEGYHEVYLIIRGLAQLKRSFIERELAYRVK